MIAENLLWILPLLLIPASFVCFKLKFYRKLRNFFYALTLFAAFLLNLTSVSFVNDKIDIAIFLLVSFIICVIFWNVLRLKNRIFKTVLVLCGLVAFGYTYKDWFTSGPRKITPALNSTTFDSYTNGNKTKSYVIKEQKKFESGKTVRIFNLQRKIRNVPLELQIDTYTLPEGYNNTDMRYHWADTFQGVKLDLIGDKDTLWSLGEGL